MSGVLEHDLKIVQLFLTRISVSSFSLQDSSVVLEVVFNDGTQKEIYRNTKLENPHELAAEILGDIITLEENINMEFDGEELTGAVNVIFHHYESVHAQVAQFLEDLQTKLGRIRTSKEAAGYLDQVRRLQNAELKFYD